MHDVVHVAFHRSQFPDAVMRDLFTSLETRKINHKFHYDSVKQTQKWLALHQAYSPSRTDPDCEQIYDRAFEAAAELIKSPATHVIGLGCGGGKKDSRLLKRYSDSKSRVIYTPLDVSAAMVLVAHQTAINFINPENCDPIVADLATAQDLSEALRIPAARDSKRIFTFFGMLPNFEPATILPRLSALVRKGDFLLLSANLSPTGVTRPKTSCSKPSNPRPAAALPLPRQRGRGGRSSDTAPVDVDAYRAGIERILPLYDNPLTRDWLLTFLFDLGVEAGDGELRFSIEDDPLGSGMARISAHFHFREPRKVQVADRAFEFRPGESIRLFYSWRHTPAMVQKLITPLGLTILDQWITSSQEEGVFLCQRDHGSAYK
jgi:uncharacterized SAM-dependent methyltransferase